MKKQQKAYLLAIIAILFWSTMSSAFTITLRSADPLNLLLYSSFVSAIVLFILILMQGKMNLLLKSGRKQLLFSASLGLLNPFLYYVVLFKAYTLLKAQEAGTLNYFWPIMLVLLSIPLLKQKINLISILAIFISFAGLIIISTRGNILSLDFSNPLGVGLAVGSALLWALFWIFNIKDKRDEVIKIFLNICFGFIYILILVLSTSSFKILPMEGIAGSVYIGLFEMGITYVLWLKALKLSSTTARVSNLVYLSPFIALFIIRLAVGETILVSTVTGLLLIVAGILIQSKYGRKT
jgi:drug/metabolite transporter (DMT)-like permease